MQDLVEAIHTGNQGVARGFTDVVNLGIGGSDLGRGWSTMPSKTSTLQ